MKSITIILLFGLCVTGPAFAQDADEKKEPLTISRAPKLGDEGLTEYTGLSEVGQDRAAQLYAAAMRITTEQALGQKNLELVIDLESWRNVIAACRRSCMSIGYITNGGGTMSGHQATRDSAAVEDFLAKMSKSLPFPDAKGDPNADNVIDHTIALIKNLRTRGNRRVIWLSA